jgi:glycosyltransferase involved in cell wall biosynthesis
VVDAPVISVIVPARDAAATIGRSLDALLAQDLPEPFEVVVVDDGSLDATAAIARSRSPRVRLVAAGSPGAAAARNAGLAAATAPVVAVTDADCFPTRGWLRAGLAAMEAADLVQGPVVPDPGAPRGPFDRTLDVPGPSAWFPTANLFARRAPIDAAGGFVQVALDDDGGRRQPLGEDTLLAWTIQRAGGRATFAADAIVHHAVFPRRAREYVLYRRHWRRLPEVVRAVPELRRAHLTARVFLERRTLLFDLAVTGLAAALGGRRAGALAVLPYAGFVAVESRQWPDTPAARFAAARAGADVVAAIALVAGSLRARTPVL